MDVRKTGAGLRPELPFYFSWGVVEVVGAVVGDVGVVVGGDVAEVPEGGALTDDADAALCAWTWAVTTVDGGSGRLAESMAEGSSRSLRKRVEAMGWGTVREEPV